ncbi:unnamed protein product [Musa hybrid cultivar]
MASMSGHYELQFLLSHPHSSNVRLASYERFNALLSPHKEEVSTTLFISTSFYPFLLSSSAPSLLSPLRKMRPLFSLYLAVLLTTSGASPTAVQQQTCTSPATVEDACKLVANKQASVGYDFCVKSLGKVTSLSGSVDLREIAVVATRLAVDHAASTEAKIEELMDLETNPKVKRCFSACLDVYGDAVEHMKDALDNLSNRLYPRASALVGGAVNAADKCEESFKDAKGSFTLAAVDKDFGRLASIAHGIIVSLE